MSANKKTTDYFLTSKRLGFRKWRDEDFDLAFQLWGNPEVTKFIDTRGNLTEKEVRELLSNELENQIKFNVQYWPIFLLGRMNLLDAVG